MNINARSGIFTITALLLVGFLTGLAAPETSPRRRVDKSRPIRVHRPDQLPTTLPAKRICFGPGYKPTMARLANGTLVMMNFYGEKTDRYHEYSKLCRSTDNGYTWSELVRVELSPGHDLLGRENWLTAIDDSSPHGLLFTTNHIIRADSQNPTPGVCRATINRSTDGGFTWHQTVLPTKYSHQPQHCPDARRQPESRRESLRD